MSTGKLIVKGNPTIVQHPIQGGVEILSVASCYRNQDKHRSYGPLGSQTLHKRIRGLRGKDTFVRKRGIRNV